MRDIAVELSAWLRAGRRFALASVVDVTGSAPRPPGTALAVVDDGTAIGGVSGGCVEGAVYELCQAVLASGDARTETFGYSDEDAFAVGLTCGGTVTVLVTRVDPGDPALSATAHAITAGTPVALARVISGPGAGRTLAVSPGSLDGSGAETAADRIGDDRDADSTVADVTGGSPRTPAAVPPDDHRGSHAGRDSAEAVDGSLGHPAVDHAVAGRCRELLARGHSGRLAVEGRDVVVEVYPSPPRLLVFGAVDFAAAVVRAGKFLGYQVTVCDARAVFATKQRFPEADEVVVDWPHRYLEATTVDTRTAVCVLTHDAKFDIPLLERALRSPVGYVGAMGSRRTHRDRVRRLRRNGISQEELSRLHSPIGLDLGGRTPEETALAIAAEIVARRNGADGGFLSATDKPIHRRSP